MLRFRDTHDVKICLTQIVSRDHENLGKWTTAQIFYHLAAAFEASIAAAPLPPGFPRFVRWMVRPFCWYVTRVRFPKWLPIPAAIEFKLKPPEHVDLQEQFDRLTTAIDQFDQHQGPFPPHPVLGRLTAVQWTGFHLRHCEHHLSFVRIVEKQSPRHG